MSQKKHARASHEIELLAALSREGCPICYKTAESDTHYFFWFFNENYYETNTLDSLTRSLGFCLAHGARLTRTSFASHQLAAVHEVLVRRVRVRLSGRPAGHPPSEGQGSILATYDCCSACRDRDGIAGRNAFWLANLLEDPPVADQYANPAMLCYPHLQAVAPCVSALTLEPLLAIHEAAMTSATESLAELRADLSPNPPDGRQDLVKTLLSFLRLAVGHDTGNEAYPAFGEPRTLPRPRDPVGDLLEGLRRAEACPVCLEVRRAWIEWIGWLDNAASKALPIDDLLPTCPEHVWPTVHLGGAFLAVAVAQQALSTVLGEVRTAIRVLKPAPPKDLERPVERLKRVLWGPRRSLKGAREVLTRTVRCPVCARLAVARDRILALLFALLEDRQHLATVEGSYGLCLKHFSRALALNPAPKARAALIEVEAAKLARLHWELEESLRKVAWHYRPEARGREQTAWQRAVVRFSGSLTEETG